MFKQIVIFFVLLVLIPNSAFAYIDPGSGSAIMSAIIGFFVAIGLLIKTFWYKIKALFTGKKVEDSSDAEE